MHFHPSNERRKELDHIVDCVNTTLKDLNALLSKWNIPKISKLSRVNYEALRYLIPGFDDKYVHTLFFTAIIQQGFKAENLRSIICEDFKDKDELTQKIINNYFAISATHFHAYDKLMRMRDVISTDVYFDNKDTTD